MDFTELVARPKRFELLTPRFVVWCSIQLSYGRLRQEPINLRAVNPVYRGNARGGLRRTRALDGIPTPIRSSLSRFDSGSGVDAAGLCHCDRRSPSCRRGKAAGLLAGWHGPLGANTGQFHPVVTRRLLPAGSPHARKALRSGDKRPSGAAGAASVLELHGAIRDDQP